MVFDVEKIRSDFPILKRSWKGKPLIYFDNAATTQKPMQVIQALVNFYSEHNANVHRGRHKLSQEASDLYEDAHKKVAKHIGAKSYEEIIFTRNTTESLNLLAKCLPWKAGDEIIVTEMEHHSNLVPFLMLKNIGVKIKYLPVNSEGELDLSLLPSLISPKTKLISCVHASNFLGTINPVKEIGDVAKDCKKDILYVVDGAQSAPHMQINVKKIGCDFFAFSSHKMCGPTGIGVLWGKKELLEKLPPFFGGGEMIKEVSYSDFTTNVLPWKFEAGTPNIADGYAFGVALDYINSIGLENISEYEHKLLSHLLNGLLEIRNVEVYGPKDAKKRTSLVSFNIKGMNAHDVATILDDKANIAVRSGHHCVMPLHRKLGIEGSVRASLYFYNTIDEIDIFCNLVSEIAKIFA
ncbi:MAG: aminotransferase class V-fold PLP-dependent enzyme [Candidatus Nanoarchaeia archaeon]